MLCVCDRQCAVRLTVTDLWLPSQLRLELPAPIHKKMARLTLPDGQLHAKALAHPSSTWTRLHRSRPARCCYAKEPLLHLKVKCAMLYWSIGGLLISLPKAVSP